MTPAVASNHPNASIRSPFPQSGLQSPFAGFTFGDETDLPLDNNNNTGTGTKNVSPPNPLHPSSILLQQQPQQRRHSQAFNVLNSPGSNEALSQSITTPQHHSLLHNTNNTHHASGHQLHHILAAEKSMMLGKSTIGGNNNTMAGASSPSTTAVNANNTTSTTALSIPSSVSLFAHFSKGVMLERGLLSIEEAEKMTTSSPKNSSSQHNKTSVLDTKFRGYNPNVSPSAAKKKRKQKKEAAEKTRQLLAIWIRISFTNYAVFRLLRPVQRLRARNAIRARDSFAAFIIQCAWRRVCQRERLRKYHAVRTISERFSRVLRFAFERKRRAATSIQKVIRGFLARRAVKKIRYQAFQASLRKCVRRKLWRLRRHRGKDFRRMLIDERSLLLDEFIRVYHQIARAEFQEFFQLTTTNSAAVFNRHAKMVRDRTVISDGIMNKDYQQISEENARRRMEKAELERIKREIEILQQQEFIRQQQQKAAQQQQQESPLKDEDGDDDLMNTPKAPSDE